MRAPREQGPRKLSLLTFPDPIPDIFARLNNHLIERPDEVLFQFLKDGQRETYTYRRVADEVNKTADFLKQSGLQPGDKVGLLLENHPAWGIGFLAILSAGAIAVPLDTLHTPEILARLIEHAGCRLLISSPGFVAQLEAAKQPLPDSLSVLMRGGGGPSRAVSWDAILAGPPIPELALPIVARDLEDRVAIMYTSGTTGNPKGVVLTGRNLFGNISKALSLVPTSPDDHLLSILPLYHVLTLAINFLLPVYRGFKLTFLDTLDPQRVMKAFADEGVSVFVCVPQFYYALVRRVQAEVARQGKVRRLAFGSLLSLSGLLRTRVGVSIGRSLFRSIHARFGRNFRLFGVGGARFDPSVERYLRDLGFEIIQAYGMTETAALITVTPVEGNEEGSVGRPLPGAEVRIHNPDENGSGEVLVKGSNVMAGYWRNSEATAAALEDGWLHTGDSGFLSPGGFLFLTGRLKDVIVLSSGKNIYPEEIEHHYQLRCPEIKEICVLGREDETSEEQREKLHAVVVPDLELMKNRGVVNISDTIRFAIETASQTLPSDKRVKSFEVRLDPLPRTTTRKVKRFELEKELRDKAVYREEPARATVPAGPVEARLYALISKQKRVPGIRPELNLELDLGFDSLERVELLSAVQDAFEIQVSDEEAAGIFSIGDLVQVVTRKVSAGPDGPGETGETLPESQTSWAEFLVKPLRTEDLEKVEEVLSRKPAFESFLCLMARLAWFPARLLFSFRVRGAENLPRDYPFLVCPNHASYLDAVFLVIALPGRVIRQLFFLGYSEVFEAGILKFLGRTLKVVTVDPDRQLRQALRLAAEGLQRNLALCVFPEGERSIDGEVKPFRRGPAILAAEFQLPVVPVAINGTYEAWPRNSNRLRLHPVSVAFGQPLLPAAGESHEAFAARLFQAVKELKESTTGFHDAGAPG